MRNSINRLADKVVEIENPYDRVAVSQFLRENLHILNSRFNKKRFEEYLDKQWNKKLLKL